MSDLEAYKHISPDSGHPTILHPNFNPKIRAWNPPDALREEIVPPKDRAHFADPQKRSLLSVATATDLTESIGTLLSGIQLSALTGPQLDDLALLVAERGVVFLRDQDLTTETQVKLFSHYGILDKHPAQKDAKHVTIKGSNADHRKDSVYTPWPQAGWHADTSFEINPPSYSLLRMEEHPPVGGDTAWVSQYGLFDALSPAYQRLFEGLHAVHTSRLQYDTILDLWGVGPNRPPIDTHHPAVRTHPVTGLKAWNVNEGFVTGFAELKKAESDKLLDFSVQHIHSADDELVRWKWEVGSVAMWDNRVAVHRVIPGRYKAGSRRGVRTTVFGEKPYLDLESESRDQRAERLAKSEGGGVVAEQPSRNEHVETKTNGSPEKKIEGGVKTAIDGEIGRETQGSVKPHVGTALNQIDANEKEAELTDQSLRDSKIEGQAEGNAESKKTSVSEASGFKEKDTDDKVETQTDDNSENQTESNAENQTESNAEIYKSEITKKQADDNAEIQTNDDTEKQAEGNIATQTYSNAEKQAIGYGEAGFINTKPRSGGGLHV